MIRAAALLLALGSVPPTDVELRAAYCMGRLHSPPIDPNDFPEEMRAGIARSEEVRTNTIERLRAYIMPKLDHLEPDAILSALSRGTRAADRTYRQVDACRRDMTAECRADWDDIENCRKAQFLPF